MRRLGSQTLYSVLILTLGIGPGWILARDLAQTRLPLNRPVTAWLVGVLAGLLAYVLTRRAAFLWTFAHEASHMLMAFATRGRVHEFVATDGGGGHVRHSGELPFLVGLAPYSIPFGSLGACVVAAFAGRQPTWLWAMVIGLALGLHLASATVDARANIKFGWQQTDFARAGIAHSLLFAVAVNSMFAGTLLAFSSRGFGGVARYWARVWSLYQDSVLAVSHWLSAAIR